MSMMTRGSAALLSSVVLLGAGAAAAQADTTIDNSAPNGASGIQPFGVPDTATYGQTITAPAGESALDSFTFYIQLPTDVPFRGEVYAWDDTAGHAVGPELYESAARTTTDPNSYEPITFATGGTPVTPGQKYVIFATTSKDGVAGSGTGRWLFTGDSSSYGGGAFQFDNNRTDFGRLLTRRWDTFISGDAAFKASFGPGTPAVASGSGVSHVGTAFSFTVKGTKAAPSGTASFTDTKGVARSGDVSCLNKVGKRVVFGIKDTTGGSVRYREFYAEDNGATGDRLAELSGSQTFTTPPRQGCRTTLTSSIKGDAVTSGDILVP